MLQYETASNANYLSSNADQNVVGNKTDGKGISGLTDNNVTTYMHTQWSGTAVGEAHHVQVSNIQNLQKFTFTYATRKGADANNTSPAPTIIELYGSTDGENYTELIATFKNADTENPLPSYRELGKYWTSVDLNPTKHIARIKKILKFLIVHIFCLLIILIMREHPVLTGLPEQALTDLPEQECCS